MSETRLMLPRASVRRGSADKKIQPAAAAGRPAGETRRAEAVALAYHEGDMAPRVVAKGRGLLAEEIIRRAREAGVFVHESRELVAVLSNLDLDSHIPPQLYLAIAEILAWVYRMEHQGSAARP
jgi:flagellar biosynthesis protein